MGTADILHYGVGSWRVKRLWMARFAKNGNQKHIKPMALRLTHWSDSVLLLCAVLTQRSILFNRCLQSEALFVQVFFFFFDIFGSFPFQLWWDGEWCNKCVVLVIVLQLFWSSGLVCKSVVDMRSRRGRRITKIVRFIVGWNSWKLNSWYSDLYISYFLVLFATFDAKDKIWPIANVCKGEN